MIKVQPLGLLQNIVLQAKFYSFQILSTVRQGQCPPGLGRITKDKATTRDVHWRVRINDVFIRYMIQRGIPIGSSRVENQMTWDASDASGLHRKTERIARNP
jgi:hypothetical protein